MKIHQLLSQKNSWNAVWLHIRDPEAEIAFASPLLSYEDLQSNVLYLCTKEELSPSLDIEGLNFLLISGKDAPGYRFHNCNLLALLHPLEPKEALEQADTLFLSPPAVPKHLSPAPFQFFKGTINQKYTGHIHHHTPGRYVKNKIPGFDADFDHHAGKCQEQTDFFAL